MSIRGKEDVKSQGDKDSSEKLIRLRGMEEAVYKVMLIHNTIYSSHTIDIDSELN